ncbi:hypothetical protein M3Y95_00886900 [Aphelenchoides besseyi]|nr:hypothetical protein M3Y95_00886900 [Aphelenchoides besseyi]
MFKPRLLPKLLWILIAIIVIFVFFLVLFSEPQDINHYLPTHQLSSIRTYDSKALNIIRHRLQRIRPQRVLKQPIKHVYPRRQNMETCRPLFGQIGVFVAVNSDHEQRLYKIAQASLKCYLKSTNYSYFYVNVDNDERTRGLCNQSNIYYKRHCVGSYYLNDVDWMLFLDGDIGVVNPNHCIEEWIDDRVDMLFYERFFNWEIMAGSFMMKNTEQSRKFLLDWANMEQQEFDGFTGYDNGVLQIQILKSALPNAVAEIAACDAIYHRSKTLEQYYDYVTCVKLQLGAVRVFPGVLRIFRRGHGWARDGQLTGNRWSDVDFLMHAWKNSNLNATWYDANVFKTIPNPEECGDGYKGWNWLEEKKSTVDETRKTLAAFEIGVARGYPKEGRDLPHLIEADVRNCYPDCDRFT